MTALTGIAAIGDYDQATAGAAIDILIALIPDPDSTSISGAQAGGGNLDEMSAIAAAHLRVELTAMKSFITLFDAPV